jgi:excisionase family DNA binding protein
MSTTDDHAADSVHGTEAPPRLSAVGGATASRSTPTAVSALTGIVAEGLDDLPLLIAVPRAAQLLGISRASAYRLAASGELPSRRLGGRVYVVTSELRALVGAA